MKIGFCLMTLLFLNTQLVLANDCEILFKKEIAYEKETSRFNKWGAFNDLQKFIIKDSKNLCQESQEHLNQISLKKPFFEKFSNNWKIIAEQCSKEGNMVKKNIALKNHVNGLERVKDLATWEESAQEFHFDSCNDDEESKCDSKFERAKAESLVCNGLSLLTANFSNTAQNKTQACEDSKEILKVYTKTINLNMNLKALWTDAYDFCGNVNDFYVKTAYANRGWSVENRAILLKKQAVAIESSEELCYQAAKEVHDAKEAKAKAKAKATQKAAEEQSCLNNNCNRVTGEPLPKNSIINQNFIDKFN